MTPEATRTAEIMVAMFCCGWLLGYAVDRLVKFHRRKK